MSQGILFHSQEELFIIDVQRKILENANHPSVCVSPFFPIFCPVDFSEDFFESKENFEEIKVSLEFPVLDVEGIFIPLKIKSEFFEKSFETRIAVFLSEEFLDLKEILSRGENFLFPHEVKRFRIADYSKLGFQTNFYNEKWISLSK